MQVAGQWHVDKFAGGVVRKTSLTENIDLGAKVLSDYLEKEAGNEKSALQRYNGSTKDRYPAAVFRLREDQRKEASI